MQSSTVAKKNQDLDFSSALKMNVIEPKACENDSKSDISEKSIEDSSSALRTEFESSQDDTFHKSPIKLDKGPVKKTTMAKVIDETIETETDPTQSKKVKPNKYSL